MTKNGKYTQIKTVRLTKEQEANLTNMGATIRDAVEYYLLNNMNELQKLKNREKYLLKQIPKLERELNNLKEELKEIREELGHNTDKDQVQIEVIDAGDRITRNCEISNRGKTDNMALANYMESKECKKILDCVMGEYGITDSKEFTTKVYEYLGL